MAEGADGAEEERTATHLKRQPTPRLAMWATRRAPPRAALRRIALRRSITSAAKTACAPSRRAAVQAPQRGDRRRRRSFQDTRARLSPSATTGALARGARAAARDRRRAARPSGTPANRAARAAGGSLSSPPAPPPPERERARELADRVAAGDARTMSSEEPALRRVRAEAAERPHLARVEEMD